MTTLPAIAQTTFESLPFEMAQTPPLTGNWRLVSMGELTSPGVVPQATELTAEFSDDHVAGSGGCNRFTGGYQTQGDQLSVGPLASTRMACEPAVMDQESRYLAALQGAQRYELSNQGLSIYYQTEQEAGVLRFIALPASEAQTPPAPQPVPGLW